MYQMFHFELYLMQCEISSNNTFAALRTAVDNDGTLDKEVTSYNDIFAFRLALKFYRFRDSHGTD
jgi:hypothetical protein